MARIARANLANAMDEAVGEDPFDMLDQELEGDQHARLGGDLVGETMASRVGGRYTTIEEEYGIMPIGDQNCSYPPSV